jgi:hypothetical protein
MEWQPIETAPKDRCVIGYDANRHICGLIDWWPGGGWNGEGCWGWDKEAIGWSRRNQPTHWMPLPEPESGKE